MYKKILFSTFIFVLATSCLSMSNNEDGNPSKGTLPSMSLINSNGERLELSSLRGKKVFVNLWATWCPPCVAEMPSIQELYNKTSNSNTAFVMISFDKNFSTAKNWIKQKNMNLPVYAAASELPELFQVDGIPSTFIFDENGNLIFRQVGMEDYNNQKFIKMLAGKKG